MNEYFEIIEYHSAVGGREGGRDTGRETSGREGREGLQGRMREGGRDRGRVMEAREGLVPFL